MKLNITTLAEEVNKRLQENKYEYEASDKRVKETLSPRRIQSYITQGLLDKPIKEGNKAYFNEMHVEKLLNLRKLGSTGLSDRSLLNISTTPTTMVNHLEDENTSDLQKNALKAIQEIQQNSNHNHSNIPVFNAQAQRSEKPKLVIGGNNYLGDALANSLIDSAPLLKNIQVNSTKVWQEVQLDSEGKCFLRLESGSILKNPEDILEKVKQILNQGEK